MLNIICTVYVITDVVVFKQRCEWRRGWGCGSDHFFKVDGWRNVVYLLEHGYPDHPKSRQYKGEFFCWSESYTLNNKNATSLQECFLLRTGKWKEKECVTFSVVDWELQRKIGIRIWGKVYILKNKTVSDSFANDNTIMVVFSCCVCVCLCVLVDAVWWKNLLMFCAFYIFVDAAWES